MRLDFLLLDEILVLFKHLGIQQVNMRLLRDLIILVLSLVYEPSIEILLVIDLQLLSLAHPYERLACRVLMIPLLPSLVGQRLQELIALSRRVS